MKRTEAGIVALKTVREAQMHPPMVAGTWMSGILVTIKDEGYGFISVGQGRRQIFVRVTDVPAELWRRNAKLRFKVYPPKKGRSWMAQEVEGETK